MSQAELTSQMVSDMCSNLCVGSDVTFPASSVSVLCYCGRKFKKRFNSLKETWTIPKHEKGQAKS